MPPQPKGPVAPQVALTDVNFNSLDARSSDVPANAYLGPLGMSVSDSTAGTEVVIRSNANLYGGVAVAPSGNNLLTQVGKNEPVSWTLRFS